MDGYDFRVGDRVRIRNNLRDFDSREGPTICSDMYDLAGKEVTITHIDGLSERAWISVQENTFTWLGKWLESLNEPPDEDIHVQNLNEIL
mgnify:FL=1|nr:MAG TPA: Thiocyanate hydrolase subunit alpha [Caudoviricetes sp.]